MVTKSPLIGTGWYGQKVTVSNAPQSERILLPKNGGLFLATSPLEVWHLPTGFLKRLTDLRWGLLRAGEGCLWG